MKIAEHQKYRKSFPYYKVQWYDFDTRAWRDIQKRFRTPGKARGYYKDKLGKWRVMEVTRNGRDPL